MEENYPLPYWLHGYSCNRNRSIIFRVWGVLYSTMNKFPKNPLVS